MNFYIIIGIMLPFVGTMIGALTALFLKNGLKKSINHLLLGLASGVMIAASIWSLILPSIDITNSFIEASIGFLLGILFLLVIDRFIKVIENKNNNMLMFSVTLHNIPEGMVVGAGLSGLISSNSFFTLASVLTLSLGIAIQNIPEGAIISLPLKSKGLGNKKALSYGFISAVVEPISAIVTLILINYIEPLMPYLLSLAAGTMFYVVINELIPESQNGKYKDLGTIGFLIGFLIMMILDVTLG